MAKKVKRKVSTVARTEPIAEATAVETAPATAASAAAASATAASSATSAASSTRTYGRRAVAEFAPDYSYVVKDLKRIGTLAGAFFIILIALSFFMPQIEQMFIK